MLKKVIVISNNANSDIKWLKTYNEELLIEGLNAIVLDQIKDAKKVGRMLYKHQLFDIFIFSRSKAVLKTIYGIYPYARLIYMPDTFNSLPDLSKEAFSSHAHTVCLDAKNVSQQMIRRLKSYGVTVFTKVDKKTDLYQAVLAGTDGVFGEDITKKDVLLKGDYPYPPFIIAHRGLHKNAQENSIEAARAAVDVSADFIELDFHMTKDKHIVVNHDDTLGRTYEKDYVIKKDTLKSLQSIKMTYQGKKTNEVIPTLPFFHKQIKDTNTSLLIESKITSAQAMKKMKNILRDMDKPPLLMSFYPIALVNFKKYLKEYSRGFLVDFQTNHMSIPDIIKITNKYNLILHPYFDHKKTNLTEILKKRGIMYCPWGLRDTKDLKQAFLSGYYGINTNESDFFKDIVKYTLVKTKYTYYMGDTLEIDLFTDKGLKVTGNIEVLFDNPLGLTIHQNVITGATLEGLTYFYLLYEVKTNDITYTIMSDLITLEVKQNG
jgi:glycerophosphoryl diester phosphodiesterase